MKESRVEGIVLKTFDYKEGERIATVLTYQEGLITLIAKGIKYNNKISLTTPFCQAEFLFTKGRSDLYKLQDGAIINDYSFLRESLSLLQAAAEMVKNILKSQLPGKPAPQLYLLLLAYLKHLPVFKDVSVLIHSFNLKLLTHEGLLSWENPQLFLFPVNDLEWISLKSLAFVRSFKEMQNISLSSQLAYRLKNQLIFQ